MSILKEKKELFESFVESVTGDEVSGSGKPALDKDVAELLLSDLETKMLEILQEAKKVMRHSKRHVLTTGDIESSFKKLTIKVSVVYSVRMTLIRVLISICLLIRKHTVTLLQCRSPTRRSATRIRISGSSNKTKST